jgi:hypothetical protein
MSGWRNYEILQELKKAPERYREKKKIEKEFEVQIVGKWKDGGWAPWQAYLPIKFKGVPYTIYLRERHDILSLKVMWGHANDSKNPRKYYGFVGFHDIFSEKDHDKIKRGEVRLFKLAEKVGAEYLYGLRSYLPRKRNKNGI